MPLQTTTTKVSWQKAESLWQVHQTPRLYSPGGSMFPTGPAVWLQFAIACFGWEFDPQISPSRIMGQGRVGPNDTVR